MELIDKKAALKALYLAGEAIKEYSGRFYEGKFNGYQCAYEVINDMPAEKERDRGHWIQVDDTKCKCSACEITHLIAQYPSGDKNYCPNCGAIMDGKAICND